MLDQYQNWTKKICDMIWTSSSDNFGTIQDWIYRLLLTKWPLVCNWPHPGVPIKGASGIEPMWYAIEDSYIDFLKHLFQLMKSLLIHCGFLIYFSQMVSGHLGITWSDVMLYSGWCPKIIFKTKIIWVVLYDSEYDSIKKDTDKDCRQRAI